MFNQKQWFLKRRSQLYLGSSEMNTSFNKFKGSIFAIIFGLIIASFVITASGTNVLTYFKILFMYAFASFPAKNWDSTLVWWAIYIVAGLALVVSFRSGMFNIGVSGQMLAAGAVIITIGIRYDLSQPVAIICALFAGILTACLVAVTIVLLKVLFNVHEVVTSILLNWTIWYLIKWLLKSSTDLYDGTHGATNPLHQNMSMNINGYNCILPLLIAFSLAIVIWFLFKKTTLGYKIKTVGLNPFAADYSGINRKRYAITSFIISGALAGVMAFIYYVAKNPSISFLSDNLPTIGFDSIAVALVGQINPWGVVGAAFLWGLIKSGGSIGTVLSLPTATGDIIFGVIIYSAACAVLLARFQPIKFLIRYCNVTFNRNKRNSFNNYVKNMGKYFIKIFKIKKEYRGKIRNLKNEISKENTLKINELKQTAATKIAQAAKSKEKIASEIKELQQSLKVATNKQNTAAINELKKTCDQAIARDSDLKATIKQLQQDLKKAIQQVKTASPHISLQELITTKQDKISVCWSQLLQEQKALGHFIHKQYESIWKKGKIGNWNRRQKAKKAIYGESLNEYINERINYIKTTTKINFKTR